MWCGVCGDVCGAYTQTKNYKQHVHAYTHTHARTPHTTYTRIHASSAVRTCLACTGGTKKTSSATSLIPNPLSLREFNHTLDTRICPNARLFLGLNQLERYLWRDVLHTSAHAAMPSNFVNVNVFKLAHSVKWYIFASNSMVFVALLPIS